ncbi:MAG: hypothetical protein ACFE9X_15890 [Promethearchaeota archaeon]
MGLFISTVGSVVSIFSEGEGINNIKTTIIELMIINDAKKIARTFLLTITLLSNIFYYIAV